MKVTIDFGDELRPVIDEHLNTGIPVQKIVRSAVLYFCAMKEKETQGYKVGYGDKNNFSRYNTEFSPSTILTALDN